MKKLVGFMMIAVLLCIFSPLTFASDEYTIHKIKVTGNEKVQEGMILRLLPFKQGDTFLKEVLEEKVKMAIQILRNERIFFNVNIFPFFNSDQKSCNILIEISGEWTYQFGFGVMPLYLMVEDRAFLGQSKTLGTELSKARQRVYWEERYLFGQHLDLQFDIYNQNRVVGEIMDYDEKYYALKGYGGSVSLSHEVGTNQEVLVGVGFTHDQLATNLENPSLESDLGFFTQNQIKVRGRYQLYSPAIGYAHSAAVEITKVLGEDLVFAKGIVGAKYAKKIIGNLQGAVKLEYGIASNQTPYYQLFNINHLNGVRGVHNLLPSNQKVLVKSELTHPIMYGIDGVLFLDTGGTGKKMADLSLKNMGIGYGIGLRYRAGMPINTIFRLEMAFGDREIAAYFVIGEAF